MNSVYMLCTNIYTEFIKPGASMESRRFRTGQRNILLSCPKTSRPHARSRLYEFGVLQRSCVRPPPVNTSWHSRPQSSSLLRMSGFSVGETWALGSRMISWQSCPFSTPELFSSAHVWLLGFETR